MVEITKHDLEGLLKFLKYGTKDDAITVNCEYLAEMVRLALDGFNSREVVTVSCSEEMDWLTDC